MKKKIPKIRHSYTEFDGISPMSISDVLPIKKKYFRWFCRKMWPEITQLILNQFFSCRLWKNANFRFLEMSIRLIVPEILQIKWKMKKIAYFGRKNFKKFEIWCIYWNHRTWFLAIFWEFFLFWWLNWYGMPHILFV